MHASIAALALLALGLAGCGGSPAPKDPATVGAGDAAGGEIDGVVVDVAIRPLADANVTLEPGGLTAVTQADGAFRFSDVPAGSYIVAVERSGHLGTQVAVTVSAAERSAVRILLIPEEPRVPYPVAQAFEGYVQASTGLASAAAQSLDPTGITACRCTFDVALDPGISRLVVGAVWDDWQADPTGPTEFLWTMAAASGNGTTGQAQGSGASPLTHMLGPIDFGSEFRLVEATDLTLSLYPDAAWPAVAQQYDLFLTAWYRGPPPEGWSIFNE